MKNLENTGYHLDIMYTQKHLETILLNSEADALEF